MSGVSFQYIDGEGGTFTLATASRRKLMEFEGVGMVAPDHFWQSLPDRDGSVYLGGRVPNRPMSFMIKACASSRGSAWKQKGTFANAFNIDKGEGRLLATLPDGTQRQVRTRFAGGLGFNTSDSPTPYQQDFPIELVSGKSHWEDPVAGTASVNFNGASQVNLTCGNDGDVPTYPTFTITPSVDHPVLALGAGTIDINVNVTSGSLTIDCETPSVSLNGVNVMGSATTTSTFFELARGVNTVHLTADSGTGQCAASWTEKYNALKR